MSLSTALVVGCAGVAFAQPGSRPASPTPPVARIAYVEGDVQLQSAGRPWEGAREGSPVRAGDRIRTAPNTTARIDFAWMSVSVSGSSQLSFPASSVLAMVLEEGRVEQTSPSGEMVKLLTADASIRGSGRVVTRRERGRTLVSALDGSFRIDARGKTTALEAGQGTIVTNGKAPSPPIPLPNAPTGSNPGDDPLYVGPGEPLALSFSSDASAHHLRILAIDSNEVLLERELTTRPAMIAIPWVGTFRWCVAARSTDGLEGLPSHEGLIAVVAK